jgi:hypothetical protein
LYPRGGVLLDIRAGKHPHDAQVLHEQGGHVGLLEGFAREAVDLARLDVRAVQQDSLVETGTAPLLVAGLNFGDALLGEFFHPIEFAN